jgi:hypothetical protein
MSSDTARGDAPAGSGNAEVRCPWNRGGDPPRKCGGWEGNTPTVICEACDSLRTTWLTRLLSEEHVGFTRRQLLGILNRHKSYTACRQIIRIMHQQRLLDNEISDEEAAAILARSARASVALAAASRARPGDASFPPPTTTRPPAACVVAAEPPWARAAVPRLPPSAHPHAAVFAPAPPVPVRAGRVGSGPTRDRALTAALTTETVQLPCSTTPSLRLLQHRHPAQQQLKPSSSPVPR